MKKDKSTEMDDKYWEGISSLQEEKDLKNGADKSYFRGLNELGKEEMKWDFDDFMAQADKTDKIIKPIRTNNNRRTMIAYAAAAVAILTVGLYLWKPMTATREVFQDPQVSTVKLAPRAIDVKEVDTVATSSLAVIKTSKKKKVKKSIAPVSPPLMTTEASVPDEEEAYVVVNGQPIYNQDEAEQIALASLKIMASNFQEGKNALEKVKYIHVEL